MSSKFVGILNKLVAHRDLNRFFYSLGEEEFSTLRDTAEMARFLKIHQANKDRSTAQLYLQQK
jgi:hypothetical protein